MKISGFIRELLDAQAKYGDVDIELEYDGGFYHPRLDRVADELITWNVGDDGKAEVIRSKTPPRLIIK